jgi:hypothetical protein
LYWSYISSTSQALGPNVEGDSSGIDEEPIGGVAATRIPSSQGFLRFRCGFDDHGEMTLDSLVPTTEPCPVVDLEWDRGHDAFDAIVRLDTPTAIVVTEVRDLWPQAGCLWIRADEVLSAEPLDAADPAPRVLDRLGVLLFVVDPALADLATLLEAAREEQALVAVHSTETGSDELLVGTVRQVTGRRVELDEVDTDGSRTHELLEFDLDEIIAVEWGTDYLRALAMLAEG